MGVSGSKSGRDWANSLFRARAGGGKRTKRQGVGGAGNLLAILPQRENLQKVALLAFAHLDDDVHLGRRCIAQSLDNLAPRAESMDMGPGHLAPSRRASRARSSSQRTPRRSVRMRSSSVRTMAPTNRIRAAASASSGTWIAK